MSMLLDVTCLANGSISEHQSCWGIVITDKCRVLPVEGIYFEKQDSDDKVISLWKPSTTLVCSAMATKQRAIRNFWKVLYTKYHMQPPWISKMPYQTIICLPKLIATHHNHPPELVIWSQSAKCKATIKLRRGTKGAFSIVKFCYETMYHVY